MPELPEVETVVRTLEHQIKDRCIEDIDIYYQGIIEDEIDYFKEKLIGEHFRVFERRGKYLLFRMDHCYLVCHLRMEGKFYIMHEADEITKHMHVIFKLDDKSELRYNDTRKFGKMKIYPLDYDFTHLRNLGPEPFSDEFNLDYVKNFIRNKKMPIKSMLLRQDFVAGIGNIYADEILARSNILPMRKCDEIKDEEWLAIINNTKAILKRAIELGGTTIRSYTSSLGVSGRFQTECSVHMQKTCGRCNGEIKKIVVGGRGTYYCPNCQK